MSVDIATLGIKVDSSDVRGATGDLRILVEVGSKAEKATDGVKNSFSGLKTALAGLGLGALIKEAVGMADTYSNITGRLSLVTSGTSELNAVTEKLYESAQRSRVGFEATANLYSSLARSTKTLGTSQHDLLQVTETINKALIVSGASAATAEGALTQLGQGFASGTLRGDELNAVLEGTPRLAQAIAEGMGVTVGQLRALGAEGKITGETVFNALKSQKDAIEQEFAKMPTTVAQSFTVLTNSILKFVGEANTASGVTAVIAGAIAGLATNLDTIVPLVAALAIALGVGFVTSAIAARIAAIETAGALATMGAAGVAAGSALLGAFGGPIGIAITTVTLGIAAFATESVRAQNVVETVNKSYAEMQQRLKDNKEAADLAKTGTGNLSTTVNNSIPGFDSLTGSVRNLAGALYQQADAAKKARIEMAATRLAEARGNELKAAALTPAARNASANDLRRGDFLGNASVIWNAAVGSGRSLLSGGRTDREASQAYARAVAVSVQASKDLREAYTSTNTAAGGGIRANDAAIKKLTGQIADLKKLRGSATGAEAKKIDARIAKDERQVSLLSSGASEAAVGVATGGGSGSGSSGKTDKQREYESAVKASENYVEQLTNETAAIGLTDVEQRLLTARREAAKAPTEALRQSILASADAWAKETLAQKASEIADKAAKDAADKATKANEDQLKAGAEMTAQIAFETSLVGKNAQERAIAIAIRNMETKGIVEGTNAWTLYSGAIISAATAKGGLELKADEAGAFADHMRDIADRTRDATQAFGELFGSAGKGFGELINGIADYADQTAEAEARIAEARSRYGADSQEAISAEAEEREKAGAREMATYGRVISGVKNLFNQKSTAYKVMEGVEKAYAAVRLALAIKEVVTEALLTTTKVAGAGARMATDAVETGSSVANSGIRAAADGVAAFAKTLASLPFPFNLVAGAAVLAALVGVGVAIAGGGGGKGAGSATAAAEPAKPTDYASQDSPYSVLQTAPGYSRASGSGFANDNASARPAAALRGGDTFSFGDTVIHADGANSETVNQMHSLLQNHQKDTVDKAREAVRQDNMRNAGRQQIGGTI